MLLRRLDIATVARFYNELNGSTEMPFLSVFDQPVSIPDFRGGPEFDASLEGGLDAGGCGPRLAAVRALAC